MGCVGNEMVSQFGLAISDKDRLISESLELPQEHEVLSVGIVAELRQQLERGVGLDDRGQAFAERLTLLLANADSEYSDVWNMSRYSALAMLLTNVELGTRHMFGYPRGIPHDWSCASCPRQFGR